VGHIVRVGCLFWNISRTANNLLFRGIHDSRIIWYEISNIQGTLFKSQTQHEGDRCPMVTFTVKTLFPEKLRGKSIVKLDLVRSVTIDRHWRARPKWKCGESICRKHGRIFVRGSDEDFDDALVYCRKHNTGDQLIASSQL